MTSRLFSLGGRSKTAPLRQFVYSMAPGGIALVMLLVVSRLQVPAQSNVPAPDVLTRPLTSSALSFSARSGLAFYHEFYGNRGYLDPHATFNLTQGMTNGLAVSPPVDGGMFQLSNRYSAGLLLRMAGSPVVAGLSANDLESQRAMFGANAAANPNSEYLWNLMPEWDQSGGSWVPNGRPQYAGLSKSAAHDAFLNYYQTNHPALISYLNQSAGAPNVLYTAITDSSPNTFYAYELGADLCLLERGIDELGDISTGVAFLRGAANQYGRPWGIDLSSWRTSTDKATTYSNTGVLLGGWSASYLRRHYYAAYMAGASVIQNEAATYQYDDGRINPLGEATQDFADFALRRHPDVGAPVISAALLVDHYSGFDPKHNVYNQSNAVWYTDIPYSSGDFMIDNVLKLAYPNHWLHGLAPHAPFANSAGVPNQAQFQAFLAAGGDSRPFEPIPFTRWGESLNIITNAASRTSLDQYKVIIMTGDIKLDARLRSDLLSWVQQGGVLLMNAAQSSSDDEAMLGATVQRSSTRSASASMWLANGTNQSEPSYRYWPATAHTAQVLAVNEANDPLILRNVVGSGQVLLATPDYLQSTSRQMLSVGTQVLDSLVMLNAPVRVSGPPVEYLINQSADRLLITLINNSSSDWTGDMIVPRPSGTANVVEYTTEQPAAFVLSRIDLSVQASVPAYDVRVYAVEYAGVVDSVLPATPVPNRRTAAH